MLGKSGVADSAATPGPASQDMKVSGALCLMSDLTELHGAAKADSLEGKSRGAGRNVRRHRARIQELAGDDFRLRADDSQRGEARRHSRIGRAHSRSDARAHARGDRISALREAARNLLRDGADADRSSNAWPKSCTKPFRSARSSAKARSQNLPGDEALLRQALLNLTRNAAEAADDRQDLRA